MVGKGEMRLKEREEEESEGSKGHRFLRDFHLLLLRSFPQPRTPSFDSAWSPPSLYSHSTKTFFEKFSPTSSSTLLELPIEPRSSAPAPFSTSLDSLISIE